MRKDYDVIIAGAGPGGSTIATLLAQQGVSVLLLDKARFPRDKVCGDGLTPQAIHMLDLLGCVDEVLDQCNCCITTADLYVNGSLVLPGKIPQNTEYPGFMTLLQRKMLDQILVRHAVGRGAVFKDGCRIDHVSWEDDGIVVEVTCAERKTRFKGRLLVGADGANSTVSRAIGNTLRTGTVAVSVRSYYQGVRTSGSQMKVYFDQRFFPGYGWMFVDDAGKANIGIGCTCDENFPLTKPLKEIFNDFAATDLAPLLENAEPVTQPAGWWASFARPSSMVADRVMLIGDAAQLTDPINGGGIHTAMESAFLAARVALDSLRRNDCSAAVLGDYEDLWKQHRGLDWHTGDLLLTLAKNPHMKELYLSLITMIARLVRTDAAFEDFCGGIFCGVLPARTCISLTALFNALPVEQSTWLQFLQESEITGLAKTAHGSIGLLRSGLKSMAGVVTDPMANLGWGIETAAKGVTLAGLCLQEALLPARNS